MKKTTTTTTIDDSSEKEKEEEKKKKDSSINLKRIVIIISLSLIWNPKRLTEETTELLSQNSPPTRDQWHHSSYFPEDGVV